MISGNSKTFVVRKANNRNLAAIKRLADAHRIELGFVLRSSLEKSIENGELLIVTNKRGRVLGFVEYHHRRDQQTTLYHIAVDGTQRCNGAGRALLNALKEEAIGKSQTFILLKCPVSLPANAFYEKCGFAIFRVEPGKKRQLNVWRLNFL